MNSDEIKKYWFDDIINRLEEYGDAIRDEIDNPDPNIERKPGYYKHKTNDQVCEIDVYQTNTGYWMWGKGWDCHNPMTRDMWLEYEFVRPFNIKE